MNDTSIAAALRRRLPPWLAKPLPPAGHAHAVDAAVAGKCLHTVCVEALCPNRAECFSSGTAAFLIMGNVCTRSCGFCGVRRGPPPALDAEEPRLVAEAAAALGLAHIVITSVTRDDLPDGGAAHFAAVVHECRQRIHGAAIELLVPDFRGDLSALNTVLESRPDVLNHNCETVPRLYPIVRPQADYRRSLDLLFRAAQSGCAVKSGIMAGLGETDAEIYSVLSDLRAAGCSMVTVGQYLRPFRDRLPVQRFVTPEAFADYGRHAKEMGFSGVAAGPLVRSSYHADAVFAGLRGRAQTEALMVQ